MKYTLFAFLLLVCSSALAEVQHPEALTDVRLAPGQMPRAAAGLAELSARESNRREKLPLQLDGALKKVKKAKYRPTKAVGSDTHTIQF